MFHAERRACVCAPSARDCGRWTSVGLGSTSRPVQQLRSWKSTTATWAAKNLTSWYRMHRPTLEATRRSITCQRTRRARFGLYTRLKAKPKHMHYYASNEERVLRLDRAAFIPASLHDLRVLLVIVWTRKSTSTYVIRSIGS